MVAIHYAPGELSFKLDNLPDSGTEIQLTYEEGTSAGGEVIVAVDGQGVMSGTIPGAPLLPGSIQLQFLVEQLSNVPSVSKSADDWTTYETTRNVAKQIDDGTDPIYVIPQSVRYNCVVETSLPLDAELIGLDPVRLPPDGKVPIYRAGEIVVISHTATTDAGTTAAGQVINLARDHQAEIVVEDSAGALLASDQYTVDREAGTVTFADPLSLIDANTRLSSF
ncbi:hypothetical protein [Endozoicomonas acroporae]|uniref:hypothetical protein n=1 Tax=Endozoicomonas acroporae TaxID=1701104 RepID=UPI0013D63DDD|nr:hypothetical protein [Endozoicomonas acroporae]